MRNDEWEQARPVFNSSFIIHHSAFASGGALMRKSTRPPTYGLMAEFDNPSDAVAAARRVHEEGYRRVDAFSPYPVEELSEAIGMHRTHMPLIVLIGGLLGGSLGFLMQVYIAVIDFPINVG